MKLSFVIPAHNEEQHVGPTIRAIQDAMHGLPQDYEVVVAADGCTDGTAQIARSMGAMVVAHDRRQIAATRNLGAGVATGDILVFVDADTQISRPVVVQMLDILAGGAVGGGSGVRLDGPVPLYAKALLVFLSTLFRWASLTGGAFLFCTREAFEKAGGWDEAYYAGEEIHLARALKKLGSFRLVPTPVLTSGRKVRTHTARELLGLFWKGAVRPSIMKDRAQLDFFYGPRRSDPFVERSN